MEQELPLSALAGVVASTRARGLVARLVVRNSERFGLVHLYFDQGRLVHVEGHLGDPVRSLGDLGGWQQGSVRQDAAAFTGQTVIFDPRLDMALSTALRRLVERGASAPPVTPKSTSLPFFSPTPPPGSGPLPASQLHATGTGGLPPLSRAPTGTRAGAVAAAPERGAAPGTGSAAGLAERDRLTTPQWQLVALVVRQMVEKLDQVAGTPMAESLLRQSLAHTARSNPTLHDLEIEPSGWLKEKREAAMTTQSADDVAEALAALLTNFELRCASLVGKEQAHQILASTAEPYRAALAQIGLDVSR